MKDPSPFRRKIRISVFKMGRNAEEKARVQQADFCTLRLPSSCLEDRVTYTKTNAHEVVNYSAKGIY